MDALTASLGDRMMVDASAVVHAVSAATERVIRAVRDAENFTFLMGKSSFLWYFDIFIN